MTKFSKLITARSLTSLFELLIFFSCTDQRHDGDGAVGSPCGNIRPRPLHPPSSVTALALFHPARRARCDSLVLGSEKVRASCIAFKSQHALQGWMLACCMTLHTLA
jgi:hypothetical protein